jgi:hypothetical protein
LEEVDPLVSRTDNKKMEKCVDEKEIRDVLKKIKTGKAPRCDRLSKELFKRSKNLLRLLANL